MLIWECWYTWEGVGVVLSAVLQPRGVGLKRGALQRLWRGFSNITIFFVHWEGGLLVALGSLDRGRSVA